VLQQSIEAGCEFLVKPVEVAELLREINTALSHQLEASA
jgi:FixJ family two-component response regulator